ncbi:hypothetical protein EW146_g8722 [Bondarzewia mesenterica]|uniref:GCF C-terminal domain-containing protein n=1 Tax=Bondarzewia mesenterica TaxID=1095465 RepID=A0A4S4LHJ1_9AGAM|nr:hypothetical protein EW146_g8722 [Bondarzewia mesenterica]
MSDAPIIFKRTKSKHTQKAREGILDTTQDTADVANNDEPSPSTLATKLKNKAKQRTKPKSTLSFGGEDEGEVEVFKVKKSRLSRKLTLGQHPPSPGGIPSNLDQATISTQPGGGPVYDQAYLSELKASTPSARAPRPPADDVYDVDVSMTELNAVEINNTLGGIETVIPSESSVLAAKEKRERLRVTESSGEDFISLSLTKRDEVYQGPHPESRLVREEDELGEGDDEFSEFTSAQERIALGKKARKAEASKRRDAMKELIADAEEVDEETEEWEQEQLRRGGLKAVESAAQKPLKQVYKPAPIPPLTPIPTLDPAVARITQVMTSLTQSHAQNTVSVAAIAAEQVQLDEREAELRELITKAELKRSWFAAFRDWVESVATFLDEKVFPLLEGLEEEHVSLLKERLDMINRRRRADDEDDLSSFLGSPPVAPHTEPEELDELGRIIAHSNPTAARRDRQSARHARRSRRQQSRRQGSQEVEEGYSTDSTLPPSDAADYQTALEKLLKKRDNVLSDVQAEEFKDPTLGIGKWFDEWRARFGDSYTGAWGGLGLVGAWEFWVRLELIGWSPFEDSRSLDSFSWYEAFYKYSRPRHPEGGLENEEADLGPDGDLVSAVISTTVIPRLATIIQGGGMDPYSAIDVRRIIDLAEEIEASVDRNSLKYQILLKAVYHCFQEAVTETDSLEKKHRALNNPRFDPEAIPSRRRFLSRQRKLLSNLLRWKKYAGELFGLGELSARLVQECMLPAAESGWEVGGEAIMRKVIV